MSIIHESSAYVKKYKCPYCESRISRKDMSFHINDKHEEFIPQGQTSLQVAFNSVNKKTEPYGNCIMCGEHTEWNEDKGRYERLCGSKKCHTAYVKMTEERLKKARGVTKKEMLSDPEFQEKMLNNRSISGSYKFSDGGSVNYVGSYEKSFLEFLDKVLKVKSIDIQAPGPTISYMYKGKEHFWITDFIYLPYNLVFDIKDGGSNPNNREMTEYREKQVAKEKAIAKLNTYNYCRLTDNNFGQLLHVMMEIKESLIDSEHVENDNNAIIRINESADLYGLPGLKKYPMPDEKHVRSAIRFFNYVDKEHERELAKNIKAKMRLYNISPDCVGEKNRLKQYLTEGMGSSSNITTFIFDMGDVLVQCDCEKALYKNNNIPEHRVPELLKTINDIVDSRLDTCTLDEGVEIFKNHLRDELKPYARHALISYHACTELFDYTIELLEVLKDRGYKLYYLSNWDKIGFEMSFKKGVFDIIKYFDGGIFSYEVGLQKPDKRIYELLISRYNINPGDAVFYDDRIENIEAAKECGLGAILFTPDLGRQLLKNNKGMRSIWESSVKISTELKEKNKKIHESVVHELVGPATGGMPPATQKPIYIVNRMKNMVFASIGHGDDHSLYDCRPVVSNKDLDNKEINKMIETGEINVYKYTGPEAYAEMSITEAITTGMFPKSDYQRAYPTICTEVDAVAEVTEATMRANIERIKGNPIIGLSESFDLVSELFENCNIKCHRDVNGVYVQNSISSVRDRKSVV